jgi:hypothetical protein
VTVNGDQLARVLGPGWQTMRYSQIADRAHELEKAADLALRLARYIVDMDETAGEAVARLQASRPDEDGASCRRRPFPAGDGLA